MDQQKPTGSNVVCTYAGAIPLPGPSWCRRRWCFLQIRPRDVGFTELGVQHPVAVRPLGAWTIRIRTGYWAQTFSYRELLVSLPYDLLAFRHSPLLHYHLRRVLSLPSLTLATIKRMGEGDGVPKSLADNLGKLQRTLEAAGLEFIPGNGGGAGIRFRKRKAPVK